MTKRLRLGMLTPSSNTVLEPVTQAMIAGLPEVSAHFARFKVTEIAFSDAALAQFDDTEILKAAELLAHARVDTIAWNGTSASWLGFDRDERLVARIVETTGIKACTSVLAFRDIFRRTGATRIGLVTPYTDDVQERIAANWTREGFTVVAERHCGIRDNFAFAEVSDAAIMDMVRAVAADQPDCIAIVCTNMRAGPLVTALEAETGLPVYDSVATAVWSSLLAAGTDPSRIMGFGRLFADPRLVRP